jgi:hypothetical protein
MTFDFLREETILISNIDFAFITDFCSLELLAFCGKMSEKLKEIQREIASLAKDLERLRRLKADCDHIKKLRRELIRIRCD